MSASNTQNRRPEKARNGFQSRPDQVLEKSKGRKEGERRGSTAKEACKEFLNKLRRKNDNKKRLSFQGKPPLGAMRRNSISTSLPELGAGDMKAKEGEASAPEAEEELVVKQRATTVSVVDEARTILRTSFNQHITVIAPDQAEVTYENEDDYLMAIMEGRVENNSRSIRRGTVITEREEKAIQEGKERHRRESFKVISIEHPDESSYGRGYHEDVDIAYVAPEQREHVWGVGANYGDSGSDEDTTAP